MSTSVNSCKACRSGNGCPAVPCIANTDDMVNITQGELEQLVRENARSIGEAKQGVIGKDSPYAHGPGMQGCFPAQTAEGSMAMDDVDSFPDENVTENREEGEDGGKGRRAVDDEEWDVVDLEAIGEVAHTLAVIVGVGYNDDLVAPVYEPL